MFDPCRPVVAVLCEQSQEGRHQEKSLWKLDIEQLV
jgi:hypothetical protein